MQNTVIASKLRGGGGGLIVLFRIRKRGWGMVLFK